MASKQHKSAGKKVKPSGPAATAVLWGLDPSFGQAASEKGEAVREVLRELGVRVRVAAPARLGDAAGAFAGLVGYRPAFTDYAGPLPQGEFVLLCNLNNAQVDGFIAGCREAGCVVGAKAVLTPANRSWPLVRLIEAVSAEHADRTKGQSLCPLPARPAGGATLEGLNPAAKDRP
ncbi:DUF3783 domain-containing protein [Paratractidigestivibacter sp.]|uniref:DUF3783 domain-containing protein n=1 Tax=Paratractidigestivibacter sp. TaxID=2847316 RepID=UPI002AC8B6D2|nr:DUF3783 domain-containing protein [Paratractidigestivibacter sp.]